MTFLPIPSPVGPWKKVLIYVKDTVISGVTYLAYEYAAEMDAASTEPGEAGADAWRKFTLKYENTLSNAAADDQYLSIEVVNLTGGQVDGSWTSGDYQAVQGVLGTLVDSLAGYITGYLTCTQLTAYARAFAPYGTTTSDGKIKHFVDSGPPLFIHNWTKPSTGGQNAIPQACTTVTEMTATRAHWGRNFLPTLAPGNIGAGGRILTPVMQGILDAWDNAYTQLSNAEYLPVVPSTMANKVAAHTLQGVTGLRIDDVPDIQRRRRHRFAQVTLNSTP